MNRIAIAVLILTSAVPAAASYAAARPAIEAFSVKRPDIPAAKRPSSLIAPAAAASLATALPHMAAETVELPKLDYGKIAEEDSAAIGKPQGLRVSVHREVAEDVTAKWNLMPRDDGKFGFRIVIHSPGAGFIRPHFRKGAGASTQLYLYGEGGKALHGPLTKPAAYAGDDFWGPPIPGEHLYVEVVRDTPEIPELQIDKVSHGYLDPVSLKPVDTAMPQAAAVNTCYPDVTCYSWADELRSGVARMYFEKDGGGYACTGALMVDKGISFRNWFLTANHCISDEPTANSLIAYFQYWSSYCNGPAPSITTVPYSNGATFKTGESVESGSDFSLLELAEDPPGGTFYLGWTTSSLPSGSTVAGIHHPNGDYQRISFGSGDNSIYSGYQDFWQVAWSQGLTEPGSSGSPLFNYATSQVIGQLYGVLTNTGAGTCSSPQQSIYGKFGVSWSDGLWHYLGFHFNDVPDSSIYAPYITALANAGITVGCGSGNYCPSNNVTRGQMAAFIERSLKGENFSYTAAPYFSDVPSGNVYFKYVQRLKDDAITAVTGSYGVDLYVTRGQMAAFLVRSKFGESFSYTQTPYFSDVPPGSTFFKYVQKLKDSGITAANAVYNVDQYVTREQMAAFLSRAFLGMQ